VSETLPLGRAGSAPAHPSPVAMDVETAIRTRRTHKVYGPDPVPRETLDELLELATWAPNHHRTNPWRFRVLGPASLARLKEAAGPEAAAKLDRAPTLVCVSAVQRGGGADADLVADEEDLLATGCAVYALLLAAHARGLAAYWRTPAVLRSEAGRAALGVPAGERAIALVHLGPPRQEKAPPERAPLGDVATYLD
jgi:nitroreductase